MYDFKKLLFILSSSEKKQAILLLLMILIMAFLDMLGVASILPLIAVLTNPDIIETNSILNFVFQSANKIGIETKNEFTYVLGLFMFLVIVLSLAFKAFTNYLLTLFVTMREYSIAKRLVEGYLNQPYSWFLSRHSADLGKTIYSEVGTVISKGIQPLINLIAHSAVIFAIISLLLIYDPLLTLMSGLILGGAYSVIYLSTRGYLKKIGKERIVANKERFISLSEAFGASKELKLGGLEKIFLNRWSDPAKRFAKHQASLRIIGDLPRYIVEALVFGAMLTLILYFLSKNKSFINILPGITFIAFAGYRLVPAFQNIYISITQLRFVEPAIDTLYRDIKSLHPSTNYNSKDNLNFNVSIALDQIHYSYPNSSKTILKNIKLEIPVRSKVGIVGTTGCGKTTMVDIILGLLEPHKGELKVDNKIIDNLNRRSWQSNIGYVPQNIFLADDTIAANIAFGVSKKEIDQKNIERVAKIACLHEFVTNDLPEKYNTTIGERGVRLSGGQRQRIGIARALYNKPKLLILDEATSALDNITEKVVMSALNNLDQEITVIIIAHRLSTLKDCDTIFLLEKGELKAKGKFNELLKINSNFSSMQVKENLSKN